MATVASLWTFDAENLTDSGPAGNSTPTTQTDLDYATGFVGGGLGKALTGTSSSAVANFEPLTTNFASPVQIVAWIYVPTGAGMDIYPRDGLGTNILDIAIDGTNLYVYGSGPTENVTLSGALTLDAWNFIAGGVGADGTLWGACNGATRTIAEAPYASSLNESVNLYISIWAGAAVIDELTIFAGELSDDDLTWLYNAGAGRTGTEILAYTFGAEPATPSAAPASRTAIVPAATIPNLAEYAQDVDAVLNYTLDWATAYLGDDTITTSTWTAETGITVDGTDSDDGTATVLLSGGEVGRRYKVTNHIVTDAGLEDDESIVITIVEN